VALGRPELVEAAVLSAQHLLAIGTLADDGFVVPHTVPSSKREVEPVTYTWRHGPTGTAHRPLRPGRGSHHAEAPLLGAGRALEWPPPSSSPRTSRPTLGVRPAIPRPKDRIAM